MFACSLNYLECKAVYRIILSPVTCPVIQYFPTLSHKRHCFRKKVTEFEDVLLWICRSQWPRSLRRRSARLLKFWVRIPPGSWMFVCCEGCVLSGRGLCDGLITRPGESYRLWCVVECDLETSPRMRRPWPMLGCSAIGKKLSKMYICFHIMYRLFLSGLI